MDKLQLTGRNLGRIFKLEVAFCMVHSKFGLISKIALLKVENSAQTNSRLSPVSYRAPRMHACTLPYPW